MIISSPANKFFIPQLYAIRFNAAVAPDVKITSFSEQFINLATFILEPSYLAVASSDNL